MVNSPIELSIIHNNKEYIFIGEIVQKAEKRPLDRERIEEALKNLVIFHLS